MIERALTIALTGALLCLGVQTYRLAGEERDHAKTKADHAEQLATLERAAREAEQQARNEERRRAEALQGIIDDTEKNLERARADAVAAASAGDGLRQRIEQLTAGCGAGSGNSASAGSGTPARSTRDLLANVQRRLDAAAEGIAQFADRAHAAGAACEAGYDQLR